MRRIIGDAKIYVRLLSCAGFAAPRLYYQNRAGCDRVFAVDLDAFPAMYIDFAGWDLRRLSTGALSGGSCCWAMARSGTVSMRSGARSRLIDIQPAHGVSAAGIALQHKAGISARHLPEGMFVKETIDLSAQANDNLSMQAIVEGHGHDLSIYEFDKAIGIFGQIGNFNEVGCTNGRFGWKTGQ